MGSRILLARTPHSWPFTVLFIAGKEENEWSLEIIAGKAHVVVVNNGDVKSLVDGEKLVSLPLRLETGLKDNFLIVTRSGRDNLIVQAFSNQDKSQTDDSFMEISSARLLELRITLDGLETGQTRRAVYLAAGQAWHNRLVGLLGRNDNEKYTDYVPINRKLISESSGLSRFCLNGCSMVSNIMEVVL
ncbi:unnamed protein product [Protopolystoma xenopodis]|uniref:Uncharacterized protein n=1 Tax=Protopolystoma xenopodis TaxID=117903 RepID=A0A3S5B9D2_9PLAT|nr:unnamed protein product [Protopolystoma xenopodis]